MRVEQGRLQAEYLGTKHFETPAPGSFAVQGEVRAKPGGDGDGAAPCNLGP